VLKFRRDAGGVSDPEWDSSMWIDTARMQSGSMNTPWTTTGADYTTMPTGISALTAACMFSLSPLPTLRPGSSVSSALAARFRRSARTVTDGRLGLGSGGLLA
jgi:hypothetical protein